MAGRRNTIDAALREAQAAATLIRDEQTKACARRDEAVKAVADAEVAHEVGAVNRAAVQAALDRLKAATGAVDKLQPGLRDLAKFAAKVENLSARLVECDADGRRVRNARAEVVGQLVHDMVAQQGTAYVAAATAAGRAFAGVLAAQQLLATLPGNPPLLLTLAVWGMSLPAFDMPGVMEAGLHACDAEQARQHQPAEFAALRASGAL